MFSFFKRKKTYTVKPTHEACMQLAKLYDAWLRDQTMENKMSLLVYIRTYLDSQKANIPFEAKTFRYDTEDGNIIVNE